MKLKGFTLVELLVVIGIIALLIGILLPSLNKARQSAKRVACASNLRQVGLGMTMYANENKDFFPWAEISYVAGGSRTVLSWDDLIHRALGGKLDERGLEASFAPLGMKVMQCPADDVPRVKPSADYAEAGDVSPRSYAMYRAFGITDRGLRFRGAGGQYRTSGAMNWTAIGPYLSSKRAWYEKSSDKIIVGERPTSDNVLGGYGSYLDNAIDHWGSYAAYEAADYRSTHGMAWNYLCHDGHVESGDISQILLPALNKARAVPKTIAFSSSLRTLSRAMVTYENQWKMYVPGINPIDGENAPSSDKQYDRPGTAAN